MSEPKANQITGRGIRQRAIEFERDHPIPQDDLGTLPPTPAIRVEPGKRADRQKWGSYALHLAVVRVLTNAPGPRPRNHFLEQTRAGAEAILRDGAESASRKDPLEFHEPP